MRILYTILTTIVIIITLIAIWFYFYLRVNTKDVSDKLPFSEIIDKELILDRDIFLLRNNTSDFYKVTSTVFDNELDIGAIDEENMIIEIVRKGTPLSINKATIQSHGESGIYGLITGVLHTKKYNILFKQRWGTLSPYILDDSDEPTDNTNTLYFTFNKPIWVTETEHKITKTYFLPEL